MRTSLDLSMKDLINHLLVSKLFVNSVLQVEEYRNSSKGISCLSIKNEYNSFP